MNLRTTIIFSAFCLLSNFLIAQKINGISFVSSKDSINFYHVKPVKEVNANYAALIPYGFIENIDNPVLHFNDNRQWFGEREKGIRQYATAFRKEGIKLMIKPQIWISHGQYTGLLKMQTEKDWQTLEQSYENFILMFAKTAQAINADVFCIGTELEKFVTIRPFFWQTLIVKVRKVFKGKITYAANWDEYQKVIFWNQLDFIGVNAYFPVSDKKTPSVSDFQLGWKSHKNRIRKIYNLYKKPILFTEFGYRSVDFTGKKPWDSTRILSSVNLEAQRNGLQAIYNEFWKENWFAGGFLWKWFHKHNSVGGLENNRFTPQNKPSEQVLKELYGN